MTLKTRRNPSWTPPSLPLLSLLSNSILLRHRATSFIHSARRDAPLLPLPLISCKAADICVTMPLSLIRHAPSILGAPLSAR